MGKRFLWLAAAVLLADCGPQSAHDGVVADQLGRSRNDLLLPNGNNQVCPGPSKLPGLDVSEFQGIIDWPMVKSSGVVFAIARTNHGSLADTKFAAHWSAMKANGIVRGVYSYLVPSEDVIKQADLMLSKMGPLEDGDLPPVVDVEENDGIPQAQLTIYVKAWLDHVEAATHRKPLIYGSASLLTRYIDTTQFVNDPLWTANYGVDCPQVPAAYSGFVIHQYNSTTTSPGIVGNVDHDYFNGTMDDLRAMGTCSVQGDILAEYNQIGGMASVLGKCVTSQLPTADGMGHYNHFERGSIYSSPSTQAHEVHGAIHDKWKALTWEKGVLGYPTADQTVSTDGNGAKSVFQHGTVAWTSAKGAFALTGSVHDLWQSLGNGGCLGYPTADAATSAAGGITQTFENGTVTLASATAKATYQCGNNPVTQPPSSSIKAPPGTPSTPAEPPAPTAQAANLAGTVHGAGCSVALDPSLAGPLGALALGALARRKRRTRPAVAR